MVSNQQNRSINSFISQNRKSLIFVVVFLTLLFVGGKMFGASPFTDYFEGYDLGDLSGQGSWATSTPYYSWQVSTTTVEVGDQAIDCYDGYCGNTRTGTPVENGKWVFWTYAGDGATFGFWIKESTSDICRVDIGYTYVRYYNGDWFDTEWEIIHDEYHPLSIEWDSTLNQCRIQYAYYPWSDWFDSYHAFSEIDRLDIFATTLPDNNKFIDNISDTLNLPCDSEHCGYCEEYTSCINANCSWDYSIYLQDYYCFDLPEPDPDECGAFYKCQYCESPITCGEQLNCQWIDRGYGDQCYMEEPTIPPGQVDWEVPDLDDCSGLPALDTIVCEIKNLITGVFMPSTTTTEALYQTVGAFKEKFPFNYIASLDTFFSDIAEDLEATTTIPIEILGATSTVSFVFWEATTTIGGAEETLRNVLMDFTTFIVLLGWFAWFISLIKRFF